MEDMKWELVVNNFPSLLRKWHVYWRHLIPRLSMLGLVVMSWAMFWFTILLYETACCLLIQPVYLPLFWVGLKPPLGPFFRSPRFRFPRPVCSSPLGPCKSQHCGHIGLLCIPRMIHEGDCGVIGVANDDCRGNRSTRRKLAPAPLCPTTNPIWPGPVSNPGPQRWEASD
jgi:hypothetical protein